jgi:hypothetical protein
MIIFTCWPPIIWRPSCFSLRALLTMNPSADEASSEERHPCDQERCVGLAALLVFFSRDLVLVVVARFCRRVFAA